jgi:anti-sigma regulatory factor (Ser/Thr protein kinase)
VGAGTARQASFHHEALFYAGDDDFVARCCAFVEEGLDRGEPVLVMVGRRKLELLREGLGDRAGEVNFEDMELVGRNPARIIPAWARFVADHADEAGGGMRGIGEPVWADRRPDELEECRLHESLINVAFAETDSFRLVCPYDTTALPDDVIAEARHSHPVLSYEGTAAPSRDYSGIDTMANVFSQPLPDPPEGAEEHRVTVDELRDARQVVRRHAETAGLDGRADDLVLAVNEILSNSLRHAHEDGVLRLWSEPDGLVCEVRDHGHIVQPLIGREEPAIGQVGGHGIWLVNLVCDLVQVRSSPDGSVVRMKMSPAGWPRGPQRGSEAASGQARSAAAPVPRRAP